METIKKYIKYKDNESAKEILAIIKKCCYTAISKHNYSLSYFDDVYSKSVEDVLKNIESYDEKYESAFNWIYTIVKNNYLLAIRYQKRFVEIAPTTEENYKLDSVVDLFNYEEPDYEYFSDNELITLDEIVEAVESFVADYPRYGFFIETLDPNFKSGVLKEKYGFTETNYKSRMSRARGIFYFYLKSLYPTKILPKQTSGIKDMKIVKKRKKNFDI